jgi:hypothetical protein
MFEGVPEAANMKANRTILASAVVVGFLECGHKGKK